MATIVYLSTDGVGSGVGASQVLPYVERLARRGRSVVLHSFEARPSTAALRQRLGTAGVDWRPQPFGSAGTRGGLGRVARAARFIRGAELVHARSDLAAAATILARPSVWVWDVRSLWADQRVACGLLRAGSPEERVVRRVEAASAARAAGVVSLSAAAVDVLCQRHGEEMRTRATVIPTCVDLGRFPMMPMPDTGEVRLLLSGSFNALYDLDLTMRLFRAVQQLRPAALRMLRPTPGPWDAPVVAAGGEVDRVEFDAMPDAVAASHAGLAMCRTANHAAIAGAVPTKIAEFLACGRPVVVSRGLGDMDGIVARHRCGVVVDDVVVSAQALCDMLDDPSTPARCRAAAAEHFDLDTAVDRLLTVYDRAWAALGAP